MGSLEPKHIFPSTKQSRPLTFGIKFQHEYIIQRGDKERQGEVKEGGRKGEEEEGGRMDGRGEESQG